MNGKAVPDIILERYRLGELPSGEMAALRARVALEAGLRARIEALERSDSAILASHPAGEMARAIDSRVGPRVGPASLPNLPASRSGQARAARRTRSAAVVPGSAAAVPRSAATVPGSASARPWPRPRPERPWYRRPAFAVPAGGLILACCLLMTSRPAPDQGNIPVTEAEGREASEAYAVRLKGAEAGLAVFRKSRGGAELLAPHSLAKSGDTLQLFYHSRGPAYGLIFSVDGSGSLTLHLPETGNAASALQAGAWLPLPHAYRLDRAPRLERFFLITAPQPFAIDALLDRARASFAVHHSVPDSLEGLEVGYRQYPYTLRKPGRDGRKP